MKTDFSKFKVGDRVEWKYDSESGIGILVSGYNYDSIGFLVKHDDPKCDIASLEFAEIPQSRRNGECYVWIGTSHGSSYIKHLKVRNNPIAKKVYKTQIEREDETWLYLR